MKINFKLPLSIIVVCLVISSIVTTSYGQSVGIHTRSPATSAALEVALPKDDNGNDIPKGILIPRIASEADRDAIQNPVNGLMIYFVPNERFQFYKASIAQWVSVGMAVGGGDGDGAVDLAGDLQGTSDNATVIGIRGIDVALGLVDNTTDGYVLTYDEANDYFDLKPFDPHFGNDGQIIFNENNAMNGSDDLTWDYLTATLNVNGDLEVTGTVTSGGMLTVVADGADITGDVNIDGGLDVTGTVTSGGMLTVVADGADITGDVNIDGGLDVTGTVTSGGMLTVVADGADITGDVSIDGDLDVTGTVTSGGMLTVVADGADITGDVSIDGNLQVSGETTLDSTLIVMDTTYLRGRVVMQDLPLVNDPMTDNDYFLIVRENLDTLEKITPSNVPLLTMNPSPPTQGNIFFSDGTPTTLASDDDLYWDAGILTVDNGDINVNNGSVIVSRNVTAAGDISAEGHLNIVQNATIDGRLTVHGSGPTPTSVVVSGGNVSVVSGDVNIADGSMHTQNGSVGLGFTGLLADVPDERLHIKTGGRIKVEDLATGTIGEQRFVMVDEDGLFLSPTSLKVQNGDLVVEGDVTFEALINLGILENATDFGFVMSNQDGKIATGSSVKFDGSPATPGLVIMDDIPLTVRYYSNNAKETLKIENSDSVRMDANLEVTGKVVSYKVVKGVVASDGNLIVGQNIVAGDVARSAMGEYTISHNLGTPNPVVHISVHHSMGEARTAQYEVDTDSVIKVYTFSNSTQQSDERFSFTIESIE